MTDVSLSIMQNVKIKMKNDSLKLKFRPHGRSDIFYRVKWLSDKKVNKWVGDYYKKGTNKKEQEEWFDNYQKDKSKKFFTILADGLPIGLVGLSNISEQNRNANLFVLIGEEKYRGIGIGKKASEYIIDYGFDKLGLHKISLGVTIANKAAVKCYKSAGLVVEGVFKDEVYRNGRYYDDYSMAVFNKKRK